MPYPPHPDRALPAGELRDLARRLYAQTADLPLVCLHGHVEVELFADDLRFDNPAELLVRPDHYVTRMLVSQGVDPAALGVHRPGETSTADPREVWRLFCAHWHLFLGTPSRYWLEHALAEVLEIDTALSPDTADETYDAIEARLAEPAFRPRALLDRFGIEVISTTDPATSELAAHARLETDLPGRVLPTFRPDAVTLLDSPGWADAVTLLGERADFDTSSYAGYLEALRRRRQAFVAAGARATDHGHRYAATAPLSDADAERVFARALTGTVEPGDADAFAANMLYRSAEMSVDDGLVMQIHPGVWRNHNTDVFARFGSDVGYDIPVPVDFTAGLQPLLDAFGNDPAFRLILFTIDETTYSRELAPIAGVYPSVRLGAPWWFLDTPDGMMRFRELVTDTAGFFNTSGFVDDTRAFLSIPARHDLSRRIDAGFLARLVAEHRLDEDEAGFVARQLAYELPKLAYARRD